MVPLVLGLVVALWGSFVTLFPALVNRWLLAAERAGLMWVPLARSGTGWTRMLGLGLALAGAGTAIAALLELRP